MCRAHKINGSTQIRLFAYFLILSGGVAIIILVDLPGSLLIWREIQNTGHTLAFALFAYIIYQIIQSFNFTRKLNLAGKYSLVFILSFTAGAGVEGIQLLVNRDAEIEDIIRDLAGIVFFIGINFAIGIKKNNGLKAFTAGISTLVLLLALMPLGQLVLAYYQRSQAFPVLVDFHSAWSGFFLGLNNVQIKQGMVDKPSAAGFTLVRLNKGQYPGFALIEPESNWSGYQSLCFDIYSQQKESFELKLRIFDQQHSFQYHDRFNLALMVKEGLNAFCIDLNRVKHAPARRVMDMDKIDNLALFAVQIHKVVEFYMTDIRLETSLLK